jgi:hypothetical protein
LVGRGGNFLCNSHLCTLPVHIIDCTFLKVTSCHQTHFHVPSVLWGFEQGSCQVTVLYKEPCQSIIPSIVRFHSVIWFLNVKVFALLKSLTNLSKCMVKVSWMKRMYICGDCLMGEGQMRAMKQDLDAHLSSLKIWKTGFMHMCMKTGITLMMSLVSFPTCFTVCFLQDCHSSTPIQKYLLNGLVSDFDEGIIKLVQYLDKCPNRNGNYIEKLIYIVSSSDINIIWMNKVFF